MRFSAFRTFRRGVKIGDEDLYMDHTFPEVQIENELLDIYRSFFDFSEELPFSYLYILAQRAQLALMLDKQFTISLPGMIHLTNNLSQFEDVNPSIPLKIDVSISVESKIEGSLYPKAEVTFYQDGIKVADCQSGYLSKRKSSSKNKKSKTRKYEFPKLPSVEHSSTWNLSKSLGKQYSKVSGDNNPIHSSKLFAKFVGFKQPIIHGWCSVSQVIREANQFIPNVNSVEVNFNKPIFLPSVVQIDFGGHDLDTNSYKFAVNSPDKNLLHLYGQLKSE